MMLLEQCSNSYTASHRVWSVTIRAVGVIGVVGACNWACVPLWSAQQPCAYRQSTAYRQVLTAWGPSIVTDRISGMCAGTSSFPQVACSVSIGEASWLPD